MPTRLNNFQAHLARNNPNFNVNKNRGNVRVVECLARFDVDAIEAL